jgi:hypothetical protein
MQRLFIVVGLACGWVAIAHAQRDLCEEVAADGWPLYACCGHGERYIPSGTPGRTWQLFFIEDYGLQCTEGETNFDGPWQGVDYSYVKHNLDAV